MVTIMVNSTKKGDVGVRVFSVYVHVDIVVIVIEVVALTEKMNV